MPDAAATAGPASVDKTAIGTAAVPVGTLLGQTPWASGALRVAKQLRQIAPLSWSDPRVQFPLAAAQRQTGNVKDAERFYVVFAAGTIAGPWRDAARSERWLADRKGSPPKPLALAHYRSTRPYLDGSFDEPFWQSVSDARLKPLAPSANDDQWDSRFRIAYDRQFLYLAVDCRTPDAGSLTPTRPRPRDPDLSHRDRVEIYIDLDRDYATYYRLVVDGRGWVAEDCWGDRTWNPTWFVASQADSAGYRIEAAIPLRELTGRVAQPGDAWAFNVVRIVPGRGLAAWSRPAGVEPAPAGFGLLLFGDPAGQFTAPAQLAN